MNTKIAWIVLIIVVLAAGTWYALSPKRAAAPTDTATTTPETVIATGTPAVTTPAAAAPDVTTITLTDAGFSPADISVRVGDTVRFVNSSSRGMWVASDNHPTHTQYDGTSTSQHCAGGKDTTGTFDECSAAPSGSSWEYTFEKAGTFGFHNHVSASNTGTVVVK